MIFVEFDWLLLTSALYDEKEVLVVGAPVLDDLPDEADSMIFVRDDNELLLRVMVKSGLLVSTVLREDEEEVAPFDFDDEEDELDDFLVSDLPTGRS